MSACARCAPRRSTTSSPSTRSPISAARRSSCRSCSTRAPEEQKPLPHLVRFFTAAAPPPAAVLAGDERGGLRSHPSLRPDRDLRARRGQRLEGGMERARRRRRRRSSRRARACAITRSRRSTCSIPRRWRPCRPTAQTMGEVMFRGNVVMKGYLKNKPSTDKAFDGGWFHSGDLGVKHPDGYVQLRDRSKDIIISGRREHLLDRGRGRALRPSGRAARGGRGAAGREMGRDALRLRRNEAGRKRDGRGTDRLVPRRGSRATSARAPSCSPRSPRPRPARCRNSRCASARKRSAKGGLSCMARDAWPRYCRALLAASVASAARQFPGPRPARRRSASTTCARP